MGPVSGHLRTRFRRLGAGAGLLSLLAAISSDVDRAVAQESAGPEVRVGVALDQDRITLTSGGGLRVEDALTGQPAGDVGPGGTLVARAHEDRLSLGGDLRDIPEGVPSVRVVPKARGMPVSVDGRPYRGSIELRVSESGKVSAINELLLEDYLLGVVPLEIGPRSGDEHAAVEAQAVAARTYAVAQLGNHAEAGFDVFGTVSDQVYGGIAAEREQSTAAVQRTAGMILMFEGRPIRAYYHSTCGGNTAAIEEVMDREPAPYLQSVSDESPDGTDYCAASPRYRWEATWTRDELRSAIQPGVKARFGSAAAPGDVRSVEILGHTPSGRVRDLALRGDGFELVLSRLDIRRALVYEGRILNSTDFAVTRRDDGLVELNGRGYGHGAGMCQWGAIGRARAGQDFDRILSVYYPGAELVNAY
jgi:stage II sporulation protein D